MKNFNTTPRTFSFWLQAMFLLFAFRYIPALNLLANAVLHFVLWDALHLAASHAVFLRYSPPNSAPITPRPPFMLIFGLKPTLVSRMISEDFHILSTSLLLLLSLLRICVCIYGFMPASPIQNELLASKDLVIHLFPLKLQTEAAQEVFVAFRDFF